MSIPSNAIRLRFHVCSPDYEVVAMFQTPEDAAMFLGCVGKGFTLVCRGVIVWREGLEDQEAGESYDHVASVVYERLGE
jgi:hypothetical protein